MQLAKQFSLTLAIRALALETADSCAICWAMRDLAEEESKAEGAGEGEEEEDGDFEEPKKDILN